MIDGLVKWSYRLFKDGTAGQVWKKLSNAAYDIGWGSVDGTLPAGGTTGQILSKASGDDFDTEWENAGASYLVYTALLTQSGTDAPVATILENTLGGTVVWTRYGTGYYKGTLSGMFLLEKTFNDIKSTPYDDVFYTANIIRESDSVIAVTTFSPDDGNVDDRLYYTFVEIRVYP